MSFEYFFDNINVDDLRSLVEMEPTQELSQYFDEKCQVETINKDEETYRISGILGSGIMDGGYDYSLTVRESNVAYGGHAYSAWQMSQISVGGVRYFF